MKRTILAAAALIAVAFAGSTVITPLYPLYRQALGFSEITLTLIYAAYVVGNVVAVLFFGRLSDRMGRRNVALGGLGAAAVGTIVFACAQGTAWLFVGRVLLGAAVGVASGTGTAWLAELYGKERRAAATIAATCANFTGIALGPLVGGVLAQYAPWPLRLSFVVYLAALACVAVAVARGCETVADARNPDEDSLRPRIGVPAELRRRFAVPAITAFGCFSYGGFYFALAPSTLIDVLHEKNLALGGAVVFELSAIAAACIVLTRALASRTSMLAGLALLVPALAALALAQVLHSLPILLGGTAVGGAALAIGYRGSLQVVNEIAPSDRRAEMVSSYYLCCFVGNSIPVIGIGLLAAATSSQLAAIAFAATIALFAVGALIGGIWIRETSDRSPRWSPLVKSS